VTSGRDVNASGGHHRRSSARSYSSRARHTNPRVT
jgi:hypothetical protein